MKENKAFQFIGNMPRFDDLLSEVLLLTDQDWSKYTDRKLYGGAAAENTKTIPLMFDLKNRINSGILHENHECFSKYIDDVVIAAEGCIGQVSVKQAMLTKLDANTVIPTHRDRGPLTEKTHRIHVPVITNNQCVFTVGDESMNLGAGQIWVIDNTHRYHGVENKGQQARVHLIIDAI
jgi:hypothetical protein